MQPGFRTRNIGNMIRAVVGYVLILLTANSFEAEPGKEGDLWFTRIAFVCMCVGYVFSYYNWRGMLNRLPVIFRKNILLRIVVSMVVAVLCVCAVAFVAAVIE